MSLTLNIERTTTMKNMESLMAVPQNAEGIIGKFFYYSTSNIMIPKTKFIEIGQAFGLPKYKPAKESKASAYRCATTAIKDRVIVKGITGTEVYRIYCRDNKKENAKYITRELVKETLNSRTNEYRKLANICFDKENEVIFVENEAMDPDVDVHAYCQQAQEMYDLYCTCYTTDQVDAVIDDILQRVQANKISIHGNLFFIPKQFTPLLNLLEDYIAAISEHNLNPGLVMSNSMFVVDDERQRQKMTDEFYANYKKDISFYQERVQHFIDSGCESKAVIQRWLDKIGGLQQKKATYEAILQRRLDDLNKDYEMLKMQSQELAVRNIKGQMAIQVAA